MKAGRSFITALVLFSTVPALSQTNCTVPLSPILRSVSVQPETSRTEFAWTPGETDNIAGYIFYIFSGGDGVAVDTLWDPAATSHVITNTAPRYSSVTYVVAAHRLSAVPGLPGCTSPLSNPVSTIFCEAAADTCNRKINIGWNPYASYGRAVISYSVMMSVNGEPYSKTADADPGSTGLVVDSFPVDATCCFFVRANLDDGSSSTSNRVCLSTRMQRPPDWIYAGSSSFGGEHTFHLSFEIDPLSEITDFVLEKSTDSGATWQTISSLKPSGSVVNCSDNNADMEKVSFYRLSAMNSCDIPVVSSNVASNLSLRLDKADSRLNLTWNAYRHWPAPVASYRLFLDTGAGFSMKAVVDAADTTYSVNYSDIMYEVSGDRICMYIVAEEELNQYGFSGTSISSTVCTEPEERITVPNLFTPNGDLLNDTFKPVLSFIPSAYHLVVSNRKGITLFESRDFNEAWNGRGSGNSEPDGVCLWFLRVTTPDGKKITRKGTVTILANP